MCGLAGYLGASPAIGGETVLRAMGEAVAHRGPDDQGVWMDEPAGIGLVHRRLAVVDLSANGHQPMRSASGRYVLAYNGEIYNHRQLRRTLEEAGRAPNWRGGSDTETLLAAIDAWGLGGALRQSAGMFALALWDRERRELHLARDRLGEKPLYYGHVGHCLLFGSDLAALRRFPGFAPPIDHEAVRDFVRYGYVPAPASIYAAITKVAPGEIVTIGPRPDQVRRDAYWTALAHVPACDADRFGGSEADALDELEQLLRQAVGGQMIADVPLGAFLSGGIDSSLVVATMQALSPQPVQTFTIGFEEDAYDEAAHARRVAAHLGSNHHELYLRAADALEVIPALPGIYAEPFADVSQIPTFLVSKLARERVTVALSGDGGDELFGGYNRHVMAGGLWPRLQPLPPAMRALAARGLLALPTSAWDGLGRMTGIGRKHAMLGEKLHKAAQVLASRDVAQLYERLLSRHEAADDLLAVRVESARAGGRMAGLTDAERMMVMDLLGYLPDDVLAKVDRASMAVSLESRVPFLDHRLVAFALRLPLHMKVRNGRGKWLLRQLLDRYLPRSLTDRPKMGFAVPIGQWLRGPLKQWAGDLLSESRLRRHGLLDPAAVGRLWTEHANGRRDRAQVLWHLLMLQAWLDARHP